jgi:hypothetical protein
VNREGTYPPPPFWPDKLTVGGVIGARPLNPIWESPSVQHDFVADGSPGPCVISFLDGEFFSWWPTLTVERAEERGRFA